MNNKNNYNKNFIIIYFKNLFFGFSIHISWEFIFCITYIIKIYFFKYQDIFNCLRFLLLGWEYLPVMGSSKLLKF